MPAIRWGIAGFGWVARDYMAPAISASGGLLAAVADPSPAARAAGERCGARAFATVDAMLSAGGIHALYVATPNHLHLHAVEAAAAHGVPILCEKPMAASLADAERMARAVVDQGVLYGTAFDQRHHPAHVAMRRAIADGVIGRPVAIRIHYCCWVDPRWTPPVPGLAADSAAAPNQAQAVNWRADPAAAGGGAVVDLAPHGLDLAHFLLGEPVERLHMTLQRRVHDYAVEDGGMITGITAAGVLVSLHVAYNCPEALPRRRLEVVGDAGQLLAVDTMGQTPGGSLMRLCGRDGSAEALSFDTAASPFTAQAAAFATTVDGAVGDWSVMRDLALMRRFDAAYHAALPWL